jgi:predicted DNA-binding antitoxin AbrB/MazE fold protein
MTVQRVTAVFENGVFRPIDHAPLAITEGQQVRLVIETDSPVPDMLALVGAVYAALSPQEVADLEEIIFDRSQFFDSRDTP